MSPVAPKDSAAVADSTSSMSGTEHQGHDDEEHPHRAATPEAVSRGE